MATASEGPREHVANALQLLSIPMHPEQFLGSDDYADYMDVRRAVVRRLEIALVQLDQLKLSVAINGLIAPDARD